MDTITASTYYLKPQWSPRTSSVYYPNNEMHEVNSSDKSSNFPKT